MKRYCFLTILTFNELMKVGNMYIDDLEVKKYMHILFEDELVEKDKENNSLNDKLAVI